MSSSAPLRAVRTLSPKMLGVQPLQMLQSPLAGHKGVRPSLEGHTFTWLTFDESGEPLPEAALSQILLDQQSLGGDLKDLPITHIRGLLSSVPRLTDDFVVGCDELKSMQGQQLCQQPQGWVCLALSRDPRAAGNACLGVPVGFPLSLPLDGPATPSWAALQAIRTLSPYMLGDQALQMLQSPWRVTEEFGPPWRVIP